MPAHSHICKTTHTDATVFSLLDACPAMKKIQKMQTTSNLKKKKNALGEKKISPHNQYFSMQHLPCHLTSHTKPRRLTPTPPTLASVDWSFSILSLQYTVTTAAFPPFPQRQVMTLCGTGLFHMSLTAATSFPWKFAYRFPLGIMGRLLSENRQLLLPSATAVSHLPAE